MQLSAAPVRLNYGYDNVISFKSGTVSTFDSLAFDNNIVLQNAKDITINKDQLVVLTDNIKLADGFTEIQAPLFNRFIESSLIKVYDGPTEYYLYALDPTNTDGGLVKLTQNLLDATVFSFAFPVSSSTIQIYYDVDLPDGTTSRCYFTRSSGGTYISAGPITSVAEPDYTFYYSASGDSITLIASDTKMVWADFTSGIIYLQGISATSANEISIPSNSILKFTRNTNNNSTGDVEVYGQSDLVKYAKEKGSIEIEDSSYESNFNYLLTSAYKTLSSYSIDANIAVLKNYYSPQHVQTAVLTEQLRSYNKIYSGLNQKDGHENLYLGYNASASNLIFDKDAATYFHFPYGTDTLPLSDSTLIEYGAYAGVTPFRSDRIYKKVANYKNYTNWGTSSGANYAGNILENGMYFCTWLSAASDGSQPVWVDRYYDPARVNLYGLSTVVLSSSSITDGANNYPNLVWDDVPSNLRFDPGVLYYYQRIGDTANATIVDSFSGLTYHITQWGDNLINEVTGLTAGEIVSFTPSNSATGPEVKQPFYIVGDTYGVVDTNESDFINSKGTTLSFFAYRDSWSSVKGEQIVGNYFNGGVGVFNNNEIVTPYFTVAAYTTAGGNIYTFNSALTQINTESYTTFASGGGDPLSSTNFVVRGAYDRSFYVVDNYRSNHYLATYDPDDLITQKVPLSSTAKYDPLFSGMLSSAPMSATIIDVCLYIDYDTNTDYIITKTRPFYDGSYGWNTVTYNRFTGDGSLITAITSAGYNNFVIDLSGNPVFYNSLDQAYNTNTNKVLSGTAGCVNSANIPFILSGTKVVRGTEGIITITGPEHINCDQDDYIWIVYNNYYLGKFTSEGAIVWSKQINTEDTILNNYSNRVINFVAEQTSTGPVYYGLLLDGKSNYIYKIDSDGNTVAKTYVPGLIPNGDCTGFDAQRKYIKPNITVPGINAKIVVGDSTLLDPTPSYITLNYGTSALAVGWHHFAVTFAQDNRAYFYVDGEMVDSYNNTAVASAMFYKVYNYNNNPQISLGATNFKTTTVNEWIEQPTEYLFNGYIGDVRLYNIALTQSDIKCISKNYMYNQFNSLNWTIPTGTRAYVEEIERFFLHRLPGSKSQYFNIRIKNSQITDPAVRSIVENNIRNAVTNAAPTHTTLSSIIWE